MWIIKIGHNEKDGSMNILPEYILGIKQKQLKKRCEEQQPRTYNFNKTK